MSTEPKSIGGFFGPLLERIESQAVKTPLQSVSQEPKVSHPKRIEGHTSDASKSQSIKEYIDSLPQKMKGMTSVKKTLELCEKYGISLDSPWPPVFPKTEEPKPAKAQEKVVSTNVVNLPIWPATTRGTPNSFLRGALFAAIQGKDKEYFKRHLLACRDGITITFTGEQLNQSDLDVWEQAVELARPHQLGNVCHFTVHGFLKLLGQQTGKSQHEWLKGVLSQLGATFVEIKDGHYTYGGGLLEFIHDDTTDVYALRLNPTIIALYQAGWTQIDWEVRQKLRKKPLALWLHGYLSSDATNYPTKVETLHRLCGSKTKELRYFRKNLKEALADLEEATGIKSSIGDDDLVTVERIPTPSQARHLENQKTDK